GGAGQPVTATLDRMYLPLRLGKNKDPNKVDDGRVLDHEALLACKNPFVICGAAGSGKTTWMRWTYRRLMELVGQRRAGQFVIELRDVGRVWGAARPKERTIEAYLCAKLAEGGVWEARQALVALLKANEGPRPVLLVDGWDELGELGKDFREKLVGLQ